MPRYALDHRALRQFLAVADAGSVRGGAAALRMSQPPLTQAIKQLEEGLGLKLFSRLPKGMVLTPAGLALAQEARDILVRLERAERLAKRALEPEQTLRIGFVSAALNGYLQALLKRSLGRPVELTEMTTPQQEAALLAGQINVGLLHPPVLSAELTVLRLGRDPLVAVFPEGHRLACAREVSFEQIARESFVLFPREQGPSLMGAIERLAFEVGCQLRIAATASRVHSQLAIIAGGVGIGLIAKSAAMSMNFQGVRYSNIVDTKNRLFLELAVAGDDQIISELQNSGFKNIEFQQESDS